VTLYQNGYVYPKLTHEYAALTALRLRESFPAAATKIYYSSREGKRIAGAKTAFFAPRERENRRFSL